VSFNVPLNFGERQLPSSEEEYEELNKGRRLRGIRPDYDVPVGCAGLLSRLISVHHARRHIRKAAPETRIARIENAIPMPRTPGVNAHRS
jgi:hypothetical protein